MKLKVLGAGSIGNHLAQAARCLDWDVCMCDIDPAALERTRAEIYPGRYGSWDTAIELASLTDAPRGGFDVVAVGTPPDSHVELAIAALDEEPRAILVEKPLCPPTLERAQELAERAAERGVAVLVGYNHAVAPALRCVRDALPEIGAPLTLDVEFREHWGGIFTAHPWLAGPADSYLGYAKRGGGASGEHSHAIHLWQNLAHALGAGRVVEVGASLDTVRDGGVDYDRLCLLNLRTERGLLGRVVQDVVTSPPRKWGRIQGEAGSVEFALSAETDVVRRWVGTGDPVEERFAKSRPDDFIEELRHVEGVLEGRETSAAISLERGLETMLVLAAAHRSAREGRSIQIEYAKGCTLDALRHT